MSLRTAVVAALVAGVTFALAGCPLFPPAGGDPNNPDFNDPTLQDKDGDGLPDAQEIQLGTDPNDPDTDGDGLTDGAEVEQLNTDPLDVNTDNDTLDDGVEVGFGLDPTTANGTGSFASSECSGALLFFSDVPSSGQDGVYSTLVGSQISDWRAGDNIVIGTGGLLVNSDRLARANGLLLGAADGAVTQIASKANLGTTFTLADGRFFAVEAGGDQTTVANSFFVADQILVLAAFDGDTAYAVNLTRCLVVSGTITQ